MSIADHVQQLYSSFGDIDGISIEIHRELVAVRVDNKAATATIFLQGAQLSDYQPHTQKHPVIWVSDACEYKQGKPLRGGIPICWPWFGDLFRNPTLVKDQFSIDKLKNNPSINTHAQTPFQAHGFVRDQQWQLSDVTIIDHNNTQLRLDYDTSVNTTQNWLHNCQLTLVVNIGKSLNLELSVTNNSSETLYYSSALHSYFAVGNINQAVITGLENKHYIDCLQGWDLQINDQPIYIDREIDSIYHDTSNTISINDKVWKRMIHINSEGSNSAIVWNPWIEKAKQLSQFNDDDYQAMLCIETANAEKDFITLQAGNSHRLAVTIRAENS